MQGPQLLFGDYLGWHRPFTEQWKMLLWSFPKRWCFGCFAQ